MQLFERPDGITVEACQFQTYTYKGPNDYSALLEWLIENGVESEWHPMEITEDYEINDDGDVVPIINHEHLIIKRDDYETRTDENGAEYMLLVPNSYEVRVELGDYLVKRTGEVAIYNMAGDIFEAIFTAVITNDPAEWEFMAHGRLPYHKTLGYWRNVNNRDLVSEDEGKTYWSSLERPLYQPKAETIHRSREKKDIANG